MRILIAADMEGVSGVCTWDHVDPGTAEYTRFRAVMTGDINAAVRGAITGGAEEVSVTDGHASASNIQIENLDSRARLTSGTTRPLGMVQGVHSGLDGVLLVGYHAMAGAPRAILDHTWSSRSVHNLWLNDRQVGETGLNAAVCGHFNVPVLMVSGDRAVCEEAGAILGEIEMAVVKRAAGRYAAECLPVEAAQELIFQAAEAAVRTRGTNRSPAPFTVSTPVLVAVEFASSDMADNASLLPGSQRTGGRRVEFQAPDMLTAYQAFRSLVALSR